MSDPKTTLPLALGLGLLAGLAGGQLLGGDDRDDLHSDGVLAATGSGERSADGSLRGDLDNDLLVAEVERLSAELAAARGGRSSVDAAPTVPGPTADGEPGEESTEEGIDAGPALELLLDELATAAYRDAHRAQAESDGPMSLAMSLVYTYQNQGRLPDALRILELTRQASLTNSAWQVADWNVGNLAQAFRDAGDDATATRLYLDSLRMSPENWGWAEALAELDPAGGLAVLQEQQAADPELDLSLGISTLLAASGELDEALALLRGDGDELGSYGWDLFLEHDPEAAEAALAEAARGDDPFAELGMRYVRHLLDGEREDEAKEEIERLLALHPDHPELVQLLSGLDTERGLELVAAQIAELPDSPESWGRYADLLNEAGRADEAIEARLRAFELGDSTWIPSELMEAAPDRALPILQARADRSSNDELWGDLADAYWRAGQHEQAKAAWLRARKLDTDDGEWSGKLSKLEQGIDPLGESNQGFQGGMVYSGLPGDFGIIEDFEVMGY